MLVVRKMPKSKNSMTQEDTFTEENFYVEHVQDSKIGYSGGTKYLLEWMGYPHPECVWKPKNNLNCSEPIEEYE